MKMKNSEIVAFLNICAGLRQKRLPVRLAYAIKKNISSVQEAAAAYTDERKELIDRYDKKKIENGEYLEEDSCYIMKDKAGFEKDMSELLGIETEVEIHTVSIAVVEKCDDDLKYDALTMEELDVIDYMLTE